MTYKRECLRNETR